MSPADAEPFRYRKTGRSVTTVCAVAGVWGLLLLLIVTVDAAPWLMALVGLATLPAVLDLLRNPLSGLDVGPEGMSWFWGARMGAIGWHEIDHVRLDTRLDLSVRAAAVLRSGRQVRLPYECTPPHRLLEAALEARGIRTERHHFSLIG